jgi:hypothetical protein
MSSDGGLARFQLNWQLTPANWNGILQAIDTEARYVELDLSACTKAAAPTSGEPTGVGLRSNGIFAPNAVPDAASAAAADSTAGKDRIVKLILPAAATAIQGGATAGAANGRPFLNFISLQEISGANIETIGINALRSCTKLTKANFPKAKALGAGAFYGCTVLASLTLDTAGITDVPDNAFYNCTNIPLTSLSLPKATVIGASAFRGWAALKTLDLPLATEIGNTAFRGCTALVELKIPKIEEIGNQVFYGCVNTAALAITMGNTAPAVGTNIFTSITSARAVTVKTPSGAAGYDDDWKKGLRGLGWDGTQAGSGTNLTENQSITLTVTTN